MVLTIVSIGILFFLSKHTVQLLSSLLFRLIPSKTITISLLSLLLYPGTVVHELSHLIIAAITLTPVKSMKLTPEVIDHNTIRAGSVTIAHVDIFRRTIIGIAPLFVGLALLWVMTYYFLFPLLQQFELFSFVFNQITIQPYNYESAFLKQITEHRQLTTVISLYLLFSISATMYSSKKDLEALVVFVPVMMVLGIIAYILGFQISWLAILLANLSGVFEVLNIVLMLPLLIHLFLLIFLFLLNRITRIP